MISSLLTKIPKINRGPLWSSIWSPWRLHNFCRTFLNTFNCIEIRRPADSGCPTLFGEKRFSVNSIKIYIHWTLGNIEVSLSTSLWPPDIRASFPDQELSLNRHVLSLFTNSSFGDETTRRERFKEDDTHYNSTTWHLFWGVTYQSIVETWLVSRFSFTINFCVIASNVLRAWWSCCSCSFYPRWIAAFIVVDENNSHINRYFTWLYHVPESNMGDWFTFDTNSLASISPPQTLSMSFLELSSTWCWDEMTWQTTWVVLVLFSYQCHEEQTGRQQKTNSLRNTVHRIGDTPTQTPMVPTPRLHSWCCLDPSRAACRTLSNGGTSPSSSMCTAHSSAKPSHTWSPILSMVCPCIAIPSNWWNLAQRVVGTWSSHQGRTT